MSHASNFKISIQIHKDNLSRLVESNSIMFYSVKPSGECNRVIATFNVNTIFLGTALVDLTENRDIPCTLVSIKSI